MMARLNSENTWGAIYHVATLGASAFGTNTVDEASSDNRGDGSHQNCYIKWSDDDTFCFSY